MLLATAERDALLKPIQTVSGIVERRHTLPILSNLLIRKTGTSLSFLSTDIEVQISTSMECEEGKENQATTVGARKLQDILRALPPGPVSLKLEGKRLQIQSGKSRFALATLAAEDFPTVAPALEYKASLTLPQKDLKQLLALVQYAMAQQDIRYYLNGLLLIADGKSVKVVATDGHRLAFASMETDTDSERQEVIIPRKTVIELERLLEGSGAEGSNHDIKIDLAQQQVRFSFSNVELTSKLVEGKFPDYQRVIPTGYKNKFDIRREDLIASLQRAAILTSDKFKGVRCVLADNSLKISCTNTDQEEAQEELEIVYTGDPIDIGFNVSYLLDVLTHIKSEVLQISMGDSNSSALITTTDHEEFRYVVMPMRI